jgi:hypothetical protein
MAKRVDELVSATPRAEATVDEPRGPPAPDSCFNSCHPSSAVDQVCTFLETVDVSQFMVSGQQKKSNQNLQGRMAQARAQRRKEKKTEDYLNRWNPSDRSWVHKHLNTPRPLSMR